MIFHLLDVLEKVSEITTASSDCFEYQVSSLAFWKALSLIPCSLETFDLFL